MVGIWCVSAWQQLGCPPCLHLVELGPGRGEWRKRGLRGTAARCAAALLPAWLHLPASSAARHALAGLPPQLAGPLYLHQPLPARPPAAGTLMADLLRGTAAFKEFSQVCALTVH